MLSVKGFMGRKMARCKIDDEDATGVIKLQCKKNIGNMFEFIDKISFQKGGPYMPRYML